MSKLIQTQSLKQRLTPQQILEANILQLNLFLLEKTKLILDAKKGWKNIKIISLESDDESGNDSD